MFRKIFVIALVLVTTYAHAQQKTPRQLFPGLFEAVQSSDIFPDNKTFVDCTPKFEPSQIMKSYNEQKGKTGFDLKEFLLSNFTPPASPTHAFQTNIEDGIRKHIDTLWQVLQRKPDAGSKLSSLAALPNPYIVPGGRFREIYYWDSYFTMLGLQQSHQENVIENMIDNFAYLIDTYGFIPNGNRAYYLTRSQPPFFAMMVNLLAKSKGTSVLMKYQPQLIKEYNYWMLESATLAKGQAAHRAVRMPDGSILNRYWDESDQPREESYIKDVDAAKTTTQALPDFYHHIRAAAASGWDFSSRWFTDPAKIGTIQTADLVPVDLNCLMYNMELTIARSYQAKGNKIQFMLYLSKAAARKKTILKYFWDEKNDWFNDYNWTTNKRNAIPTLAAVFPLEFKIATAVQAKKIADGLKANFLKPGGLVTTLNFSGQQWDAPNGWAPLQYMAIDGLENYNHHELARDIAARWMNLNIRVFKQTGKLLEKYNVVDTNLTAGGGEYPLQDGFGWTNGVLLKLMNRYNFDEKKGE
ncbi:alpha,alpha-trehalase TreA [Mucilaginibacter psychrotolerans]|uniref:Alpha,alpha-trehalase TreA n=1 Tax=Mucilaginibacter psychrotolerans TaxID=1524096 RepID=A0A4Y8RYH1_9SPHI|nr:alpha,alpha-trehalase TreA [Mucilaginibacter psychrotolerans]TFF30445.1 alpha,alpha-trehalase TreA [Mucilaginibacter psychrotolerans]